jgi:hypothetical protein
MRAISHRVSRITARRAPRHAARHAHADVPLAAEERRHVPATSRLVPPDRIDGRGDADDDGLLITRQRAGLYVISNASGEVVGRIFGDYVIGFTATYRGVSELFGDLESAKATIAQLHARGSSA